MNRRSSLSAVAVLLAVAAAAPAARAADLENGKKLYEAKCAMCHAKDGKGNPAMGKMFKLPEEALGLVSEAALAKPEADLAKTTTEGRNKMPSFKDKLQAAEIADILAYARSLAKAPAKGVKAAESGAAKAYAARCASCHGKDGKGNAALAKALKVEPASLDLTATAKSDAELLAVMRKGAGKMPSFKDKLSEQEIAGLASYSRSLAPRKTEAPKQP